METLSDNVHERNHKIVNDIYIQVAMNPVKFTVAGFFKIDLNLFANVNIIQKPKKNQQVDLYIIILILCLIRIPISITFTSRL